ncbi:hypothetical protein BE08_37405 [Sorangium cellulosum]|uniref:Secreted protein n=1 Tax=Sorangium cellulosum TaxID=56 RepID=A0A150PBG9_SORCE|nr:hypothetical protein BE08_37405 [Sorangium cellulosum]
MILFGKMFLPLALLGGAVVLGGCVGDASLEGDDGQQTLPGAAEADDLGSADSVDPGAAEAVGTAQQAIQRSNWTCYVHDSDWNSWSSIKIAGYVTIDWGHNQWDAEWACNAWRGACGGECWAQRNW